MTTITKFKFSTISKEKIKRTDLHHLDTKVAQLFRLDNGTMTVDITNLGAAIVSIYVPDKSGKLADICLGFSDANDYLNHDAYMGAVAGRYCNRIKAGEFSLNGTSYTLNKNDNGLNHLHGGNVGFDKQLWEYEIVRENQTSMLKLTLVSEDMQEGYPGTMTTKVVYSLDMENRLSIKYSASSDKDTVVNLTNHTYFNLNGHNKGDILRHKLFVNANKFVRIDKECIPNGELVDVFTTPFDFTTEGEKMHTIGERIGMKDCDLESGCGYDHCFILNKEGEKLVKAATLQEDYTGRQLNVYTNAPGIQVYTGNFLKGAFQGKQNCRYGKRAGVCLETEWYPDSPNHTEFPSTTLKAGAEFNSETVFGFGIQEARDKRQESRDGGL